MARLGFNVESIALFRESGGVAGADPVHAAFLAELGGADAIVCPIHEDFRPLTEKDVRLLKTLAKIRFHLRIAASDKLVGAALSIRPDVVILLPKGKADSTPNGGLNLGTREDEIGKTIQEIQSQKIVVGCFVEPILQQIKAAAGLGADCIELHAGGYAAAQTREEREEILENIFAGALAASKLNLGVGISGGIDFQNASVFAGMEKVEQVQAGRAIVGRALWIGMEQAVRDMAALVH